MVPAVADVISTDVACTVPASTVNTHTGSALKIPAAIVIAHDVVLLLPIAPIQEPDCERTEEPASQFNLALSTLSNPPEFDVTDPTSNGAGEFTLKGRTVK
jgi:hypothetical protein